MRIISFCSLMVLAVMIAHGQPFGPPEDLKLFEPPLEAVIELFPSFGPDVLITPLEDNHYTNPVAAVDATGQRIVVSLYNTSYRSFGYGLRYSLDGGESWNGSNRFPGTTNAQRGSAAFDAMGRAYYCYYERSGPPGQPEEVFVSTSDDLHVWSPRHSIPQSGYYNCYDPKIEADRISENYSNRVYVAFVDVADRGVKVSTSMDRGSTWSIPQLISGEQGDAASAPEIKIGPNGEVYCQWTQWEVVGGAWHEVGIGFTSSMDGGTTWDQPKRAQSIVTGLDGYWRHKNSLNYPVKVGSTPGMAVDENSGRIYLTWTDSSAGNADIWLVHSDDEGKNWSERVLVNNDSGTNDQWWPAISVSSLGIVCINFYDSRSAPGNRAAEVYIALSSDDGASFDFQHRIGDVRFEVYPMGAGDWMGDHLSNATAGGNCFAFWMDNRPSAIGSHYKLFVQRLPIHLVEFGIMQGFNMISLPVTPYWSDPSLLFWGNISISEYDNGYVPVSSVFTDRGYWANFVAPYVIQYIGAENKTQAFPVKAGWNIIGSISHPIATSTVTPPGLVANGKFFRYDPAGGGYYLVSVIEPGAGHWVKCTGPGTLTMSIALPEVQYVDEGTMVPADRVTVTDALGRNQSVFAVTGTECIEMPPAHPGGDFDVRFANGNFQEALSPEQGMVPIPIHLARVVYPITVAWDLKENTGISYWLRRGTSRDRISNSGSITINRRVDGLVRLEAQAAGVGKRGAESRPTILALRESYPNPFNPSTEIRFGLPEPASVSLVIYDLLGRKVSELANGSYEAGYHSATWNASDMASGVYLARFNVVNELGNVVYTKTNKLVLMK